MLLPLLLSKQTGSLCSNRHFLPTESCIWLEVTRGGRGKQSVVHQPLLYFLPAVQSKTHLFGCCKDQSSLGNLKDSFFHCIFYGVVGYQFFARSWALTEEIESLARILMRMATKKVKKGENPPSPDSFYGQLHIYWEMEDPCARFSLELLLALEDASPPPPFLLAGWSCCWFQ